MKFHYLLPILFFFGGNLSGQSKAYIPDSLSTLPAIPREAVDITAGLPSGPDARLAHAIYRKIRFPRTALATRTGGKVLVYGIVDTSGVFTADSAGLFLEQSVVTLRDSLPVVATQEISLGCAHEFMLKKKKWIIADGPKKWSRAQQDLVLEAVRVTRELPRFNPGTINGKAVAALVNIPVVFRHGIDRF